VPREMVLIAILKSAKLIMEKNKNPRVGINRLKLSEYLRHVVNPTSKIPADIK